MHASGFSQLAVCDGNRCLGLLTANTIARWLAAHLAEGVGLIEERPVSEVMRHQEHDENFTLMAQVATVADGLTAFDDFLNRGLRLDAILITNGGRPAEVLLGIVTIHDIPNCDEPSKISGVGPTAPTRSSSMRFGGWSVHAELSVRTR